jgi:sugar-specific transcriptional regulator TrmB
VLRQKIFYRFPLKCYTEFLEVIVTLNLENDGAQLLFELGFTKTQANLYLTLLKFGKSDAKTLATLSNIHRTEVYRALEELQKKGLVDKEIDLPIRFVAVPPALGLLNSINKKREEIENTAQKTVDFIKQFGSTPESTHNSQEYSIRVIDGRKRIAQKIKDQHSKVQHTVDIITLLPRWLQILDECLENYQKALERGVQYRLIIGLLNDISDLPKSLDRLVGKPNFKIKPVAAIENINSAVFDQKEATLSYFPCKNLGASPLIVTNHPILIELTQGYFESIWVKENCSQV